nr:uncharacterized protein LOC113824579 [Penaeus vannamei]
MASLLRCVLLLHLIFLRADGYGYAGGPPLLCDDRGLCFHDPEFSFCQRVCLFLKEYGIGWKWVTLTVDMGLFPIRWYVDLKTAAPPPCWRPFSESCAATSTTAVLYWRSCLS